jgi:hypothetical protein
LLRRRITFVAKRGAPGVNWRFSILTIIESYC